MRKRIINALEKRLAHDHTLSHEHHKALTSDLKLIKSIFGLIDTFRLYNPFEDECAQGTFIDAYLEKDLVNAIILAKKPDVECTQAERKEKELKNIEDGVLFRC